MDCMEADCRSFYGLQDPRQLDFLNCTRSCSLNRDQRVRDGSDWTKQHNNTCWCSVSNDRLTKERGYIAREMICVWALRVRWGHVMPLPACLYLNEILQITNFDIKPQFQTGSKPWHLQELYKAHPNSLIKFQCAVKYYSMKLSLPNLLLAIVYKWHLIIIYGMY